MTGMTEPQRLQESVNRLLAKHPELKRAAELAEGRELDQSRTETDADAAERISARSAAARERWLEMIPPMYRDADVKDLDDDQEAVRARAWLHSGSLHLILAGPVGTGKTFTAYAIGNQAVASGIETMAANVGDLMDAMRPGSGRERQADMLARRCQLLILDDLLAKATDWEAERLTLLLDERVRNQRRTIVTTNATSDQITDVWGARLMDRLRYRMLALTLRGESRRSAW